MKKIVSLLLVFAIVFSLIAEMEINSYAIDSKVENAVKKAVAIANDNSHGYSQKNRTGPDYDCSSLVYYSFSSSGFSLSPAWFNTSTMGGALLNAGFREVTNISLSSSSDLQRGDILWKSGHTEIYIGSNQLVGAHSDYGYPKTGDQNGKEISVTSYYYKGNNGSVWTKVYRYSKGTSVENKYKTTRTSATNNIAFYSWNSYSGAKYYNLRAKKIEGSTEVEGNESVWCCSNTKTTLELREGKYRVYAEAVTNSGVYKYSDDYITVTFKNPKLSASINGSNTKFSWTAYSGAHHYRLRIYKNKIWTTHVATYDNITSLTYNTTLEPGNYAALIEVFDSNNKNIYYGTAIKFKVEYKTTRTSRNNNIAFYSWPAHPRAQYYNLRVKRVEGDSWIDDGYSLWSLNGTSNHVELPEGKYVVYVDAITPDGACQYSIDTVEISCGDPKLTSSVSGNNVTFNWSAYSGASKYSLRIYKNRIWTDRVAEYNNLTSRSKTVTLPLGDYAAFVEAYNSSDKSLQYSNAIKFSVLSDLQTNCSHTYTSTVTKSATCTTAGTRKYTCSKCGYSYTKSIVALEHDYSGYITKAATCTEKGIQTFKCSRCTSSYTLDILPLGHNIKTKIYEQAEVTQTTGWSGSTADYCTRCDYLDVHTWSIGWVRNIDLSKSTYAYTGNTVTPSVKVVDSAGKVLKKGTDYTVAYANGRKNVGKYAVKVSFQGKYSGCRMLYFKIVPKGTALSKLTAGKKAFNVKWKKQATQTSGYQLQYSTNASYSGAKAVAIKSPNAVSKTIKGLAAKKYYYVRVRTYKTVGGVNYFSGWSKSLKVKTK